MDEASNVPSAIVRLITGVTSKHFLNAIRAAVIQPTGGRHEPAPARRSPAFMAARTPAPSWETTKGPASPLAGKRGEVEPEDLSNNLIVQLGTVTEHLNRHWYERNAGQVVTEVQRQVFHPVKRWMAATLDGMVEATGAVRALDRRSSSPTRHSRDRFYLRGFSVPDFRSLTPGPPPFSSMNSTPAASSAWRRAASFAPHGSARPAFIFFVSPASIFHLGALRVHHRSRR